MQKQHNIWGIMKDQATEGSWRLDLNAESQIEQPEAPYLGPAESPSFEHDGFMLPPPATEELPPLEPFSLCAWSCAAMRMVLAFMFGDMYLYFDQYGGSE